MKAAGPAVIPAGTSESWNNVAMFVPATVPSRLAGCGIINVYYVLEVGRSFTRLSSSYFASRVTYRRRRVRSHFRYEFLGGSRKRKVRG